MYIYMRHCPPSPVFTCLQFTSVRYRASVVVGPGITEPVHGGRASSGLRCPLGRSLQCVSIRQAPGQDAQHAGEDGALGPLGRFYNLWGCSVYAGSPNSVYLPIWYICYDHSLCIYVIFHVCIHFLDVSPWT